MLHSWWRVEPTAEQYDYVGLLGFTCLMNRGQGERYDHVLIRTGPAADPLLFADAVQRSRAYRIAGLITLLDPAMRRGIHAS